MKVNFYNQSFCAKFIPSSSMSRYVQNKPDLIAMQEAAKCVGNSDDILIGISQTHRGAHAQGGDDPNYDVITLCHTNSNGDFVEEKKCYDSWGGVTVEEIIKTIDTFQNK